MLDVLCAQQYNCNTDNEDGNWNPVYFLHGRDVATGPKSHRQLTVRPIPKPKVRRVGK